MNATLRPATAADAPGGVTVAQAQSRVIAAMATETGDFGARITQMAVDPAHVGRGIGALLLAWPDMTRA